MSYLGCYYERDFLQCSFSLLVVFLLEQTNNNNRREKTQLVLDVVIRSMHMVFVSLKIGTTFPSAIILRRGRLAVEGWPVWVTLYVVSSSLAPVETLAHVVVYTDNVSLFFFIFITLLFTPIIIWKKCRRFGHQIE